MRVTCPIMHRPLVIDYLRTHSFDDLEKDHGVKVRRSACATKVSLNYDQFLIRCGDKLAEQCRGLIVSPVSRALQADDWKEIIVGDCNVLAWPLDRFYNEGETFVAKIDWSTAVVQEKLDGTMCTLYFDFLKLEWHVATRSVSEADLPATEGMMGNNSGKTFRELFELAVMTTLQKKHGLNISFDGWTGCLDTKLTYVYELTSPVNRVVVKYSDFNVTLLAIRDTLTGQELDIHSIPVNGLGPNLGLPRVYDVRNVADLISFVNGSDPVELEGCVVVDSSFNRVKVKNSKWVMASRAKDFMTCSPRNGLECIVDGTVDDIKPLIDDDIVNHLEKLENGLRKYESLMRSKYEEILLSIDDTNDKKAWRKAYALAVQRSGEWNAPLFAFLDEKNERSIVQWLRNEKKKSSLLDQLLTEIASLS